MAVDESSYATQVKGQVTREQAIAALQDHAFFLRTSPNYVSVKEDTQPRGGNIHIPDTIKEKMEDGSKTQCYEVVDKIPAVALFSKLLPGMGTITTCYQLTDTKDGMFIYLQTALGVSQERRWAVEEDAGAAEGFRIVEYVTINCSKLLLSSVLGQQEMNWKAVHASYVKKMGGEVGEQVAKGGPA